jgi:enoyl-CoA hydratase
MASENQYLLFQLEEHIAQIIINRPEKRNAMTLDMWRVLGEQLEAWADDHSVRVLILTGAGDKSFCAGNDISEFPKLRDTPEQRADYDAVITRAYVALRNFPKPTIAKICGFCIGGGLELAQLCDLQVSAESCEFAVTPARLGIGYKLDDILLLTSNIAPKHAKELLFTARRFPASDALRWGLISRAVPDDVLDRTVEELAMDITANAPLSVAAAKAIIREAVKEESARDTDLCARLVAECDASEDRKEGQSAFTEKRKPDFKGK